MPDDGTAVAQELAAGSVAGASRTDEVYSRTAQKEVSMIVHSILLAPERQGVIAICIDIAVGDDGACASAEDCHLMGSGLLYGRAVVVVYGDSADNAVVGVFSQHDDSLVNILAFVLLDGLRLGSLGIFYDDAVSVFAYQYDVWLVDDYFFVIFAVAYIYNIRCNAVGWSLLYGSLYRFTGFYDGVEV